MNHRSPYQSERVFIARGDCIIDTNPDANNTTASTRIRGDLAVAGTLGFVFSELLLTIFACIRMRESVIRQVADFEMALPKEIYIKLGTPGLLLVIVIGAVIGCIVIGLHFLLSDRRMKVLTNLLAMVLIAGGGILFRMTLNTVLQEIDRIRQFPSSPGREPGSCATCWC